MLLIGPPGSGKTHHVLERLVAALKCRRADRVKLITPTASMAQHLRHELARRGFAVPGELVEPISAVVKRLTPEVQEPSPAINAWLVSCAVEQAAPDAFGELAKSAGLISRIASSISELEGSGCDPAKLRSLAVTPQQRALAAVYELYEKFLHVHGFISAAERLTLASQQAAVSGLKPVSEVYLDGFFFLSRGERDFVRSLASSGADVTLTLPQDPGDGVLAELPRGFLSQVRRPEPQRSIVAAADPEQEIEEVARCILDAKRPLHEIGVILRSPDSYASICQAVFERFGIAYRLRRQRRLGAEPAVGFLRDLLRAAADGFPAEATLSVLRRSPSRIGNLPSTDIWDFDVRTRLPGEGLEFLATNAPAPVAALLAELAETEDWTPQPVAPAEWSKRCRAFRARHLHYPEAPDSLSPPRVLELRSFGHAVEQLDQAITAAAELLRLQGQLQCSFGVYLDALDALLERSDLILADNRRDVVNVLSAHEARQWELPVVFVCGLVEGGFPQPQPEDLFFSQAERRKLVRAGVELRSRDEREQDERFLFDIAVSRAMEQLVLSYPQSDSNGAPLLRSFFIESEMAQDLPAAPIRLRERAADYDEPTAEAIRDAALLKAIAERNEKLSPSGLEKFLQCPYQFFAARTLDLQGRPDAADRRLNTLLLGSIVHRTLARWSEQRSRPIGEVLEEVFDAELENSKLPAGFRTEMFRAAMRVDLERFAGEPAAEQLPGAAESGYETAFEYVVEPESDQPYTLRGRIDRFEMVGGEAAVVLDYKYSGAGRIKEICQAHLDGFNVQAPIYLSGLERGRGVRPAGMIFCGIRGVTSMRGWALEEVFPPDTRPEYVESATEAKIREMISQAEAVTLQVVRRLRQGEIQVEPRDKRICTNYCEFRDVCRVQL